MTPAELQIYNEAAAATVQGNRTRLARAIRQARKHKSFLYPDEAALGPWNNLTECIIYHCCFIDWPVKLRPNGRYT